MRGTTELFRLAIQWKDPSIEEKFNNPCFSGSWQELDARIDEIREWVGRELYYQLESFDYQRILALLRKAQEKFDIDVSRQCWENPHLRLVIAKAIILWPPEEVFE